MVHTGLPPNPRFLAPLLVLTILAIAAGDAVASSVFHHKDMTRRVLRECGWSSEEDIETVVICNMATDFGRLPQSTRNLATVVFPSSADHIQTVRDLAESAPFSPEGSIGFHFNSLYNYDDIVQRWEDFGTWVDDVCDLMVTGETPGINRELTLCLMGIVSHAVQDFYAHANWIELLNRFTPDDLVILQFPLWGELVNDDGGWWERHPEFDVGKALNQLRASNAFVSDVDDRGGLQTGRKRGEPYEGTEPWLHRHSGGHMRDVVHALAERETRLWMTRIESRLEKTTSTRFSSER